MTRVALPLCDERGLTELRRTVPVAFNTNTTTNAVNRTYAVPTFGALDSSGGLADASVGYAGTQSDGLTMVDANHHLTSYTSAPDGHTALTARVRPQSGRPVELALGFRHDRAITLSRWRTTRRR
jgi:glucoamylase